MFWKWNVLLHVNILCESDILYSRISSLQTKLDHGPCQGEIFESQYSKETKWEKHGAGRWPLPIRQIQEDKEIHIIQWKLERMCFLGVNSLIDKSQFMLCMYIHVCGYTYIFGYVSTKKSMGRCPTNGYHVFGWVGRKKGMFEEKKGQAGGSQAK